MKNLQMKVDALMRLCTAEQETERRKAAAEIRAMMGAGFYLPCRDPEMLIRDILLELGLCCGKNSDLREQAGSRGVATGCFSRGRNAF